MRRPLDGTAIAIMVLLCAIWGGQQIAIKLAIPTVSAVLQAGIRSLIAAVLVGVWMVWRKQPLRTGAGTLPAGMFAGLLFAAEFLCIFTGLAHTSASRMAVFLYTAPCFTALGLHWFVPGERLRHMQWVGMALAFAGIVVAFAGGAQGSDLAHTWRGDLLGVMAGMLWGATTVTVRATKLSETSASKTLLYQLVVSAVALLGLAVLTGQTHIETITPTAIVSMAYQSVVVAFLSYLAWFWLLQHYIASRLAVFSFLSPLFGVTLGVLVLGESVSWRFAGAAVLVLAGISLVNRRR